MGLIRVYHLISMIYSMQDRFSIFVWEIYARWALRDQSEILKLL